MESSIAATFVECLKVGSTYSLFPTLGAQTSFKGGFVFTLENKLLKLKW